MKVLAYLKIVARLVLLGLAILPSYSRAQERIQIIKREAQEADVRQKEWLARSEAISRIHNNEEKLVRSAYVKLMRYQQSYVNELAASRNQTPQPRAQIQFELQNVRTGMIEEILDNPLAEMVTRGVGLMVRVEPVIYKYKEGPEHLMYNAEVYHRAGDRSREDSRALSVADLIERSAQTITAVRAYTSYEVTVQLGTYRRTYRALALYSTKYDTKSGANIEIIDNIVGSESMRRLLADDLPPVRVPWSKYIRSATYVAIVRSIKQARKEGRELIERNAPPGTLPGDGVIPDEGDLQIAAAVTCQSPDASIEPFLGVGKGQTVNVPVTLTPSPATTPVTLTLSTINGTGAAKFAANNSTTLSISQSGTVAITGVTESSTADNIRLEAKLGTTSLDSDDFSVVFVTLNLRTGTDKTVSSDNSARATYISFVGSDSLGTFFATGQGGNAWGTHVEIVGTVTPSNYLGTVKLERDIIEKRIYDNQTLFTDGIVTNQADNSQDDLRDDNPQSGTSRGIVYDLDGPNIASTAKTPLNAIRRRRTNFRQWATIDGVRQGDPRIRASADFGWFQRLSIIKTSNGDQLQSDVAGDNIAGTGTTPLTWNLK